MAEVTVQLYEKTPVASTTVAAVLGSPATTAFFVDEDGFAAGLRTIIVVDGGPGGPTEGAIYIAY